MLTSLQGVMALGMGVRAIREDNLADRPRLTAVESISRIGGAVIHAGMIGRQARNDFQSHFLPQPTAKLTRAARVLTQLTMVHENGSGRFDCLDRNAHNATRKGSRRQPITVVARPHATRRKIDIGKGCAILQFAIEHGVPQSGRAISQHLLGNNLG